MMEDLELNLCNFEDEEFADSRYVLTSPRSLQSCDVLGVKPASLLYKPLSEFQDELLPTGLPLRAIYDRYDEHERLRQKRLRDCKEYREKVIRSGLYKHMSPSRHFSCQYEDAGYRSDESRNPSPQPYGSTSGGGCLEAASLQRQRTARLLGHQLGSGSPVTTRPHSASAVLSPYRTEHSPVRPRSNTPTRAFSSNDTRDLYNNKSLTRNDSRSRYSRRTRRSPTPSSRLEHTCDDLSAQLGRALCLSDLSNLSSRSPGRTRRIPHKDIRILEALQSKNARESQQEVDRSLAELEWEEQKLRLQREKVIAEQRRRQQLAEHIAETDMQQMVSRQKRSEAEEEVRRSMLSKCEMNETRWQQSTENQHYKRDLAKRERSRRLAEKKMEQERLLNEFKEQQEHRLRADRHRTELRQHTASSIKNNKYYEDRMKKNRQNERELEQHRKRLCELQRDCSKYNQNLKSAIAEKESKSMLNSSRIAKARDYTLNVNAKKRQQKFKRSRRNLVQKEEEMDEWKKSLRARRSLLESKANQTASLTVQQKALRAQVEREEKEQRQRRSYKRLLELAEMDRYDQIDAITYKDTKGKLLEQFKSNVIGEMRSMAATSQSMREELRKKYGKNSFAKVAFETELQNEVGRGRFSAKKNKSSVILA